MQGCDGALCQSVSVSNGAVQHMDWQWTHRITWEMCTVPFHMDKHLYSLQHSNSCCWRTAGLGLSQGSEL